MTTDLSRSEPERTKSSPLDEVRAGLRSAYPQGLARSELELKSRQVLPKPIRVVHARPSRPRLGEEHAAGLGQSASLSACTEDVFQLNPIESVETGGAVRAQDTVNQAFSSRPTARGRGRLDAVNLVAHDLLGDAAPPRERRHPRDRRVEVPEVSRPPPAPREVEETLPRLPAHRDVHAELGGDLGSLEVEVGEQVLGALRESRQPERPEVDAREEILAKRPLSDGDLEILVRPGDELKVARSFPIRAHRVERLLLQGTEEHRLLVYAKLSDLVEKQHPVVRLLQQPWPVRGCPRERAFRMPEESTHGGIAPEHRAVDLRELPFHLPS